MDIVKKVWNNVYDGLVLDDNGRWVPIAHMLARERDLLSQLRRGRVIVNGQWIPIERARGLLQPDAQGREGPGPRPESAAFPVRPPAAPAPPVGGTDPHADLVAALSGAADDGLMTPSGYGQPEGQPEELELPPEQTQRDGQDPPSDPLSRGSS